MVRISEIINHFSEHTLDDENKQKCRNPITKDCQIKKGYKDEIVHKIRFHCMRMSEIKHIIQSLLTEEIKERKVYKKLIECKQETEKIGQRTIENWESTENIHNEEGKLGEHNNKL